VTAQTLPVASVDTLTEIAKYITTAKYSQYRPADKRRETWDESVERVEAMHLRRFEHLDPEALAEIRWAFGPVHEKRSLPSMRSMQFGGKAVEAKNERLFNCSVRHVDSLRSFAEVFYLLLCGSGVGLGITDRFLDRLPNLVTAEDKTGTVLTYVVEDSIEGWADSLEALLMCYFENTPFTGRRIAMDYSKIRKEGSLLKTGGGKAPGYKPLKQAHIRIKALLDRAVEDLGQRRLLTIDAYDINMHSADAVLAGGVRRSATSVVFAKDDKLMMTAKSGDWYTANPQRARSNNSVLLMRDDVTEEELADIIATTREWGEPGFVFADHPDTLFNPCVTADTWVLTDEGPRQVCDLRGEPFTALVNGKPFAATAFWSTGVKDVLRLSTTAGHALRLTDNHKILTPNGWIEAGDLKPGDEICLADQAGASWGGLGSDDEGYVLGHLVGDGTFADDKAYLCTWANDSGSQGPQAELRRIVKSVLGARRDVDWRQMSGTSSNQWRLQSTVVGQLGRRFGIERGNKTVTSAVEQSSSAFHRGFLRGLFDTDGHVEGFPKRGGMSIRLTSSDREMLAGVQRMLGHLGIKSSVADLLPAHEATIRGETFDSTQTWRLLITGAHGQRYMDEIGFTNEAKAAKWNDRAASMTKGFYTKPMTAVVESIVADGTEEVFDCTVDEVHRFDANGIIAHNCFEISFIPVTDDGECGVQMCNLTTIAGNRIKTLNDYLDAAKAAAIIGTLQASYTDFPYLGHVAEKLTRDEALLGVSITAQLESPDILLNPEYQRMAAELVVETNKRWAGLIGINQAARTTTQKPEGTTTPAVGSMSSGNSPAHAHHMWRRVQANRNENVYRFFKQFNPHLCEVSVQKPETDDVIRWPIYVPETAVVKADITALEHLGIILTTKQNWVDSGASERNLKPITHNVSCTVVVAPEEWDPVTSFIFENRFDFAAIALLASTGDKDYAQAPMEAVVTEAEFAQWEDDMKRFIPIDYALMIENEDGTDLLGEASCVGGACEL
jgi:ribonucleotide reductase class II